MSDSNSDSQANQTSVSNDSRRVLGQDSISAENSTVSTSNVTNNTTNVLDGGAIGHALDSTNKTVATAFDFGTHALGFGSDALNTVTKNNTAALNFAGDTVSTAFSAQDKLTTKTLNFADSTVNEALGFAQDAQNRSMTATSDALSSAKDAFASALSFGGKQTAAAVDSLNQTENLVSAAYADAKGRGALTDKIMMVAIAGALFVAFMATRK